MLTKKDLIGDTSTKEWSQLLKEILFLPVLILIMWFIGTTINDFLSSKQPPIEDIISDQVGLELDYFMKSDQFREIIQHEVQKALENQ